jgi:hypothetical protein
MRIRADLAQTVLYAFNLGAAMLILLHLSDDSAAHVGPFSNDAEVYMENSMFVFAAEFCQFPSKMCMQCGGVR